MKRIRNVSGFLGLAATGVLMLSLTTKANAQGTFGGNRSVGGSVTAGNRSAFGANSPTNATPGNRLDEIASLGQVAGSERYLRENRDATQFVGADAAETPFVGSVSATNSAGFGGAFGLTGNPGLGVNNRNTNANNRGNTNTNVNSNRTINVRTQLRIGFGYTALRGDKVTTNLTKRLSSRRIQSRGPIQVALTDRTATLRGVVATEADRVLAVRLARLEPGVSKVQDELTVSEPNEEEPSPSDAR